MSGIRTLAAVAVMVALATAAGSAEAGSTSPKIKAARVASRSIATCSTGAAAKPAATEDVASVRFSRLRNPYGTGLFGMAPGGGIQVESIQDMTADVNAYRSAGARWLRIDINWASIQAAGPSRFAWRATDRVVREATRCGMHVLGVLYYTPAWARPANTDSNWAPAPAQFGRFAREAAAHYRRLGVSTFEIWNEPNLAQSFAPAASPRAYTALLKTGDQGIKRANPRATVITGGLAPTANGAGNISPIPFLQGIYARGGEPYFNDVGVHPYCWPGFPGERASWSVWYQMYGTRTSLRSIMIRHHDGAKRIWATEFGAPTYGPPGTFVSVVTQAAMIKRAYELWSTYRWAGPLFVYSGRDQGNDATTNQDWFGVLAFNYDVKPSYDTYWDLAHRLAVVARAERRR